MKILCISDHLDPLVYTASIKERFKDVDLVVSAGDLPQDYLDFVVTSLNKPLLSVYGNHDLEGFSKRSSDAWALSWEREDWERENQQFGSGVIHIGSKIAIERNIIFAGLGGSMRYNTGENQYTDFQMQLEIFRLIPRLLLNRLLYGRFVDVLLTHAPPFGVHDKPDRCHKGFKAFLWFMKTFKPKYLIHGHIHLYNLSDIRVTSYCNTQVVNAYGHYIIDTDVLL
ncbi:MAG: metallophosphoesterase [Treponema sp.]|jgi:Icc-related predicted phosphoesterase|nr:metallophosphoesterase [Treponema sp.]